MKNYLRFILSAVLLIGVCVIVIGGGIYLFKGGSSTPPPVVMVQHHLTLPGDSTASKLPDTVVPMTTSGQQAQSAGTRAAGETVGGQAAISLPNLPPSPRK